MRPGTPTTPPGHRDGPPRPDGPTARVDRRARRPAGSGAPPGNRRDDRPLDAPPYTNISSMATLEDVPVVPMFPLGTVLVPGMVLPLHVFEPRYRRMVDDCRAGDGTFGVVLIERGSEVGGGDVRTDVGTLARILRADELPDGRWILGALGIHRIRVEQWLPDEPYPRAEIVEWADEPGKPAGEPPDEGLSDDRVDVTMLLRRGGGGGRGGGGEGG